MARLFFLHIIVGVPLAALLHSVVHGASEVKGLSELWVGIFHFLGGMVCGAVVFVPAYSLQGLTSMLLIRKGAKRLIVALAGGSLQALIVLLWATFVGIEPSLPGRFPITIPMICAGFAAGFATGEISCRYGWQRDRTGW